jgi:hypothetical protein
MAGLSLETFDMQGYQRHVLPTAIARYSIGVTTGSFFDIIVTLQGTNWSLGTTDKRFAKFHCSRRYNGTYNTFEVYGSGARNHGAVSTFTTTGVQFLVETSTASSFIFQIHNSYSNPPLAGLTVAIECYGCGKPTQLSTASNTNYTSNPF